MSNMWGRAIIIVVGSAVLGSAVATLAFNLLFFGAWSPEEFRCLFGLFGGSLFFSITGSLFLTYIYGYVRENYASLFLAYAAVFVGGCLVGAAIMVVFSDLQSPVLGAGYGAATGLFWIILHRLTEVSASERQSVSIQ